MGRNEWYSHILAPGKSGRIYEIGMERFSNGSLIFVTKKNEEPVNIRDLSEYPTVNRWNSDRPPIGVKLLEWMKRTPILRCLGGGKGEGDVPEGPIHLIKETHHHDHLRERHPSPSKRQARFPGLGSYRYGGRGSTSPPWDIQTGHATGRNRI